MPSCQDHPDVRHGRRRPPAAERLGSTRLYTLVRRDFSLIRLRHVAAFELLP